MMGYIPHIMSLNIFKTISPQIKIIPLKLFSAVSVNLFGDAGSHVFCNTVSQTFPFKITHALTLKMPRKTTPENVICLYRLLHFLANFSNIPFAYRQSVWTLEQSDLGPHCLQHGLLK